MPVKTNLQLNVSFKAIQRIQLLYWICFSIKQCEGQNDGGAERAPGSSHQRTHRQFSAKEVTLASHHPLHVHQQVPTEHSEAR